MTKAMRTICLACVLTVLAQAAESNLQRGNRVMREALVALGGQKYLDMKDRVESGRAYSFYRDQLSGLSMAKVYTRYLIRPEPPVPAYFGLRERQVFGKKQESAVLFTEDNGYDVTFRGARPLKKDILDRFRESTLRNVLYIIRMRMGEPGMVAESRGSDVIDNQPVEIVDITDAENRVVTVYFHSTTKFPVRQMTTRRDPITKERIDELALYSKYRDVGGGVMWPFAIERRRNEVKIFEIFSETVVINQGLTDNLFTLPSSIKVLPAPK